MLARLATQTTAHTHTHTRLPSPNHFTCQKAVWKQMAAGRRVHLGHASTTVTQRAALETPTLLCRPTASPTATDVEVIQQPCAADVLLRADHSWVGLYEGDVGE